MNVDTMLRAGITAAQSNDKQTAAFMLAQVVRADPASEQGWFWLAQCLNEPDRRAYCLRRALALNPANAEAARLLTGAPQPKDIRLMAAPPQPTPATPVPPAASQPTLATASPATSSSLSTAPTPPVAPSSTAKHQRLNGQTLALLATLGLGVVLLACALPLGYLAWSGTLTRWFNRPRAVVVVVSTTNPSAALPTLPPSITPQPFTTLAPQATSTPHPQPTVSSTQQAALRLRARQTMLAGDSQAALDLFTQALANDPRDAEAYYRRGQIYMGLTDGEHYLDRYVSNLTHAIADLDQAIALGPVNGDYFLMRKQALNSMAYVQTTRADFDVYEQAALADLRQSLALGNVGPFSPMDEPILLMSLGRCQEGLDLARRLVPLLGSDQLLLYGQSINALCLGQLDTALTAIDGALQRSTHWDYLYTKAIILYEQGRLDAARKIMDSDIAANPSYCGCRYFLRALIELDQKQLDLAAQDLQAGYGQTWDHIGVFLYVQGRLALAAGDSTTGWGLIQQAEISLERRFVHLHQRLLDEMKTAGIKPLPEQAAVTYEPPAPAALPPQISLPAGRSHPVNPGHAVSLQAGYGPTILYSQDPSAYRIQPEQPLPAGTVSTLSIHLDGLTASASRDIEFWIWDQVRGTWLTSGPGADGAYELSDPQHYVSPAGDVFLVIRNVGTTDIQVRRLGVTLAIRQADGTTITLGLRP